MDLSMCLERVRSKGSGTRSVWTKGPGTVRVAGQRIFAHPSEKYKFDVHCLRKGGSDGEWNMFLELS